MFVFVDNNSNSTHKQVVAVNLNLAEEIQIIQPNGSTGPYQLVLEKTSGSYPTPYHRVIATFETKQAATDYCIEMLVAFHKGDKVWPSKPIKGD